MILVAGGTGTLGTILVRKLCDRGLAVRVLSRKPAAPSQLPDSVETVTADVRDGASLASAVRGCTTVISAIQGFAGEPKASPESIDRDGNFNLIAASVAAGVEHFVLVSVLDAAADHPISVHPAKFAAEQRLRGSGLTWTIVRPAAYLETWTGLVGAKLQDKHQCLVFGPGRNPINFVSARDVAALIDLALQDQGLRGQVLDVAGPENLSFVQIAERLIQASGEHGKIKHIPLAMLRVMSVLARPVSPMFARQAKAAVVMNTMDMSVDTSHIRDRFPAIPATTFDEVVKQQCGDRDTHAAERRTA
jgi:NADH dehydrogenase